MKTVYFQPYEMKGNYCEVGGISEEDPDYIYYYDEPCKILISEVTLIPKEDVILDKKKRLFKIRKS